MLRVPPIKWKDIKKIVHAHGVSVERCTNGFKLKRVVGGRVRITVIHGHGKNFEVDTCYINQIIETLDIPKSVFLKRPPTQD